MDRKSMAMDDNLMSLDSVGLCISCQHAVVVRSDRGSDFYQCQRALSNPSYPRYPVLPVLRCRGYEAREVGPEAERTESS